jgi:hypothetical protein
MSNDVIPEEPETVPGRAIAWVLGATVLVIVSCGVVVWVLAAFHLTGGGETASPHVQQIPPTEPFSGMRTASERARDAHDQLDYWSWADRATRRVRMPIGRAMDRYLEETAR